MKNYYIKRSYQNYSKPSHIVKRGLTLQEAQAHCRNPETSSSTCKNKKNVERTNQYGPWFDGYDQEK